MRASASATVASGRRIDRLRASSGRPRCPTSSAAAAAPAPTPRAPSAPAAGRPPASGQLAEQVRRVVRGHRLQHVGGPLPAQVAAAARAGRSPTAPRTRRRAARRRARRRPRGGASPAGRSGCRRRRRAASSRTRRAGRRCPAGRSGVRPGDRPPRHHAELRSPGQPAAARPHGEPPDDPVAGAGGLDRGVDDDDLLRRCRRSGPARRAAGRRRGSRCGRWAKRRRLTDPVASVIAPGSTPVTRSIGTKIRRRVATSTTSPSTRGGLASTRSVATTSRTLPMRSPSGTEDGEPHQACDEDTGGGHPGSLERRHHRADDRPTTARDTRRWRPSGRTGAWGCASTSSTSSPTGPTPATRSPSCTARGPSPRGRCRRSRREFGLSETAFTLPPTTSRRDYRLRIFTPARELPFAGHPSIGAAWVLAFADMIAPGPRRAGVRRGSAAGARRRVGRAGGVRQAPEVGPDLPGAALAAAVGLGVDDLDPDLPAGVAAAGVPFAFLPVRPDAVARAAPDLPAVAAATADQTGLAVVAVRPRGEHGTRAGLLPAGRRGRGPGDRVGGGGARGVPRSDAGCSPTGPPC